MLAVCHRYLIVAAAITLLCSSGQGNNVKANTITTPPRGTPTAISNGPGTCEYRTINYITDSLPQLCLKSSWSNANGTASRSAAEQTQTATGGGEAVESSLKETGSGAGSAGGAESTRTVGDNVPVDQASVSSATPTTTSEVAKPSATDLESGELNDASFLSFEEWKKQTLEKAGQANANIGNKRSGEGKKRDSESFQNHLDSLGDEGEIDIDIGFGSGGREGSKGDGQRLEAGESELGHDSTEHGRIAKQSDHYRSKDAGKTCKERFSYASFDAGATILKTHPGAKNAKAVLIENKDSYMLSECSTENKFVIIELSEDIWIDTVVLANYEFFSSMIRTFRVSLSDRYPVKTDKWKDVGTFEAQNSRAIQAFLIENPQIWARYIRIEFLSHYGKEYYCPLSLIRVHGTRMLESWKESEATADEEEEEENESENEDSFIPEAVAESVKEAERVDAEVKESEAQAAQVTADRTLAESNSAKVAEVEQNTSVSLWQKPDEGSYWMQLQNESQSRNVCLLEEAPVQEITITEESLSDNATHSDLSHLTHSNFIAEGSSVSATPTTSFGTQVQKPTTVEIPVVKDSSKSATHESPSVAFDSSTASTTVKPQTVTNAVKNKTSSTTSSSSSLPTIQESFFKAVSRRLNFLESNSTLSLKYIEDQSRVLREAFTRVEKKQMSKTTIFLETLNSTVLDELRGFRQQYDEIWQSTVISLESQRDEYRREVLAISSRLNILADEVVFQKRMSIVQSVLLLLCLGLVIFSRVSGGGNIDIPYLPARMRHMSRYQVESPLDSPAGSPAFYRTNSLRERKWLEVDHKRQRSDETIDSQLRSRENSPPTPISTYSRSDERGLTHPSGGDVDSSGEFIAISDDVDSPPHHQPLETSSYHSMSAPLEPEVEVDDTLLEKTPFPLRSSKRLNTLVGQTLSPPPEGDDGNWSLQSEPSNRPVSSQEQTHSFELGLDEEEVVHDIDPEKAQELGDDSNRTSIPTIHLPSPGSTPDRNKRHSFSIVRKPLPALPPGAS